eukprot:SAG31_NODE_47538_length_237_cov_3.971014_1_plen_58_part_10
MHDAARNGTDPAAAVRALMEAGCPVAALSQASNNGCIPLHDAVCNRLAWAHYASNAT